MKTPEQKARTAAYKREWDRRNKEHIAAYTQDWYEKNKEAERARKRAEYQKRREAKLAQVQAYYEQHREVIIANGREMQKRYRQSERGRAVRGQRNARRRALEQAAEGSFNLSQWEALVAFYCPEGHCLCCGEAKPLTVDHVQPLNKGGTNHISNIQPLCSNCNSRKCTRTIDYRPDGGQFAVELQ